MIIPGEICFVVERYGQVCEVQIPAHLDKRDDLELQARVEALDWISRKKRIFGQRYRLEKIRHVNFQLGGIWYSQLDWPTIMPAKAVA